MVKEKLKFNKKKHLYTIEDVELTSVTQFIDKFFEPFDAKKVARMLAKFPINKKNKKGVRFWLNEWKKDAEHGTRCHAMIEQYILTKKDPKVEDFKDFENRDIVKYLHAKTELDKFSSVSMKPEYKLYNKKLRLAGTIDLLIEKDNKVIDIVDFKTNKKITLKAYKGEKAKQPVEHLDDCKFIRYSLQLSTYAYMKELEGYTVGTLSIWHLTEDGLKIMEVPYLREEVIRMLESVNNDNT